MSIASLTGLSAFNQSQSHVASQSRAPAVLLDTGGGSQVYDPSSQQQVVQSSSQFDASFSLDANLNGVTTSTSPNDQLAVQLAKLIQGATQVDPTTGHKEISSGAAQQVASAVGKFLTSNGFSAEAAQNATTNLTQELTQGGTIALAASQQRVVATPANSAGATSRGVAFDEYSGSVNLNLNLDTGELDVSAGWQSSGAYNATAQNVPTPSGGGAAASAEASPQFSAEQILTAQTSSTSTSLIDRLSSVQIRQESGVPYAIQQLALSAQSIKGQLKAASDAGSKQAAPQPAAPTAQVASVQIGFKQAVSLKQNDQNGYGTTLYKRPNGDLATFSLRPTRVTA